MAVSDPSGGTVRRTRPDGRTVVVPAEDEAYRRAVQRLKATSATRYAARWRSLDTARLNASFPGWVDGVVSLVAEQRAEGVDLAAGYLATVGQAAGVGAITAAQPAPLDAEAVVASLRATVPAAYFAALNAGASPGTAVSSALVQSTGAVVRMALDGGRETITTTAAADDRVGGWRRLVRPGSDCPFCLMLAGRGAVYSADTATFGAHDHCGCAAAVVIRGGTYGTPIDVNAYRPSARRRDGGPLPSTAVTAWMERHGLT